MKKILVIEDNFEVRDNLCEILELADYDVYQAPNGKEGIKQALEHLPDIILCDVMMPELDGFGTLKILNKNLKTRDIPFIFLTAKAEKTDFRKGMGLGADDYITKPFDDTELLESIQMRLAKSEQLKKSYDNTEPGLQHFFSEAKANKGLEDLTVDREVRSYSAKDLIYEDGQSARWLYYLVSGKVKTVQNNEFGKELTTTLFNPGQFFGYFPLLTETLHNDSAVCLEPAQIRLIPKKDFKLLLFNNREVAAHFIKMMANKTLGVEQQLIEFAYSSVRRKVSLALVAHLGEQSIIKANREELASTAGTAKETLIRTLADFKREGLIQIKKGTIEVLDKEGLEAMPQ